MNKELFLEMARKLYQNPCQFCKKAWENPGRIYDPCYLNPNCSNDEFEDFEFSDELYNNLKKMK